MTAKKILDDLVRAWLHYEYEDGDSWEDYQFLTSIAVATITRVGAEDVFKYLDNDKKIFEYIVAMFVEND